MDRIWQTITLASTASQLSCEKSSSTADSGWALLLTCQKDLDRGSLVEVLRGALLDSAKGYVLYPTARERSAAAQALINHLLARSGTGG